MLAASEIIYHIVGNRIYEDVDCSLHVGQRLYQSLSLGV